jgi:hypothetical protein
MRRATPFVVAAVTLLAAMSSRADDRSDIWSCLAKPNADCLLESVHAHALETDDPARRASLLASIAVHEARQAKASDAVRTFTFAKKAADGIDDLGLRVELLRHIASLQDEAGFAPAARATLGEAAALKVGSQPMDPLDMPSWLGNLRSIAEDQARLSDKQGATRTLALAAEAAKGIADTERRATELLLIGHQQARNGDAASASNTFRDVRTRAEWLSPVERRVVMLLGVVNTQQHAGMPDEARATLTQAYDTLRDAEIPEQERDTLVVAIAMQMLALDPRR